MPWFLTQPNPEIYLTGTYAVLDFETSAIDFGTALDDRNRLILGSVYSSKTQQIQTFIGGERQQQRLSELIKSHDFFVSHHAKFELGWLDRIGLDISRLLCYDTMLGEWVLAGNRRTPKDLDSTAQRYGVGAKSHAVATLIDKGVDPLNIPTSWLGDYCEQDVRITLGIFLQQRELLAKEGLLHLQYARCLFTPVLADIEGNGVTLDKEAVYDEYERVRKEYELTQEALARIAIQEGAGTINWRSGKQVGEFLYDVLAFEELTDRRGGILRTAKGARLTDADSLRRLKASTSAQREFKELYQQSAKLNAKLTKSLNFFKGICDQYDGTFYGVFQQGTTGTHRLSSGGRKVGIKDEETGEIGERGIQLQNVPREYKKLFRAKRRDDLLIECDSGQLEFRVAADLGHDAVAYDEIVDGVDVHSITAQRFIDAKDPEFRGLSLKDARQPAKPQTFKPLYGGKGNTPAEQAYCKFFQEKYKGISATQARWTWEVASKKCLTTPYGMKFYWPDCNILQTGYITHTTEIYNYPIQGLATGEIIPIAVLFAWHYLRNWDCKIVLTIHDSVVLEAGPKTDISSLKDLLARAFTIDVYEMLEKLYVYKMWVPLSAEIKVGSHWGSGESSKVVSFPEERKLIWSK